MNGYVQWRVYMGDGLKGEGRRRKKEEEENNEKG